MLRETPHFLLPRGVGRGDNGETREMKRGEGGGHSDCVLSSLLRKCVMQIPNFYLMSAFMMERVRVE